MVYCCSTSSLPGALRRGIAHNRFPPLTVNVPDEDSPDAVHDEDAPRAPAGTWASSDAEEPAEAARPVLAEAVVPAEHELERRARRVHRVEVLVEL